MNNKPVFTEKQQKDTLSAKKKQHKPVYKNVLAQPLPRFWPEISEEETKHLIEKLKLFQTDKSPSIFSKLMKLGLNASLRSLKTGNVDVLLISANIKPKFIVNQILILALAKNPKIKIVCAPQLGAALSEVLSYSTCLCITVSDILLKPQFAEFYAAAAQMADRFEIPEHLVNLFPKTHKRPYTAMEVDVETVKQIKSQPIQSVQFDRLYVQKPNGFNERGFIPTGTVIKRSTNDLSDFISLNEEQTKPKKKTQSKLIKTIAKDFASNTISRNVEIEPSGRKEATMPQTSFMEMQKEILLNQNKTKKKKKKISKKVINGSQNLFKYITLNVHKVQSNPNRIKKKKKKQKSGK